MMKLRLAIASSTMLLGACATTGAGPEAPIASAPAVTLDSAAPDTMRWLYGSGEAAAVSIQSWRMLADFATARARERRIPEAVPMGIDGGVSAPSCMDGDRMKPLAVVFDVDETVLLNQGYEYWLAQGNRYTSESWRKWEESAASFARPVPGAVTGIRRLREAGITPVFNTNRQHSPEGAARAIEVAGLGKAVHLDTLYLRGDDGGGGGKDGRRKMIAAKYCVIALAGDNLGDFADVFNEEDRAPAARRQLAARGDYAQLWGNGWFALPNPVYGDSIKGTIGEVFAEDQRWNPDTARSNAPAIMSEGN